MKTDNAEVSIEPLLNYFDGIIPLKSEEKELVMEKFHHVFSQLNKLVQRSVFIRRPSGFIFEHAAEVLGMLES